MFVLCLLFYFNINQTLIKTLIGTLIIIDYDLL